MKILHLSTNDISGGAARAANRIHIGLLQNGIDSRMVVLEKRTDNFSIVTLENSKIRKIESRGRFFFDELLKKFYLQRCQKPWSCNFFNNEKLIRFINSSDFDIIHFHWINGGMLGIRDIKKISKPIVWTMHDMWPFTGGCHYSDICEQYKKSCDFCPQLANGKKTFLSKFLFQKKEKSYLCSDIVYVSPSKWLSTCAKESFILRHKKVFTIPNGLDLNIYRKIDKVFTRDVLQLDMNKKYILFGAMNSTSDKRKGYDLLKNALSILSESAFIDKEELILLVFGASKPEKVEKFGFNIQYLGQLYDDISLNLLYNCADVFIAPSREDNLPNTVVEACASGVPIVAFNIGGIPDIVEHKKNGYLAVPFDEQDLVNGIKYVLSNNNRWTRLSMNALKKARKTYDINLVSKKYIELYQEILYSNLWR